MKVLKGYECIQCRKFATTPHSTCECGVGLRVVYQPPEPPEVKGIPCH